MNIDIMTEEQRVLLLSIISNTKRSVIVGHKNPDGDALGACLALAGYLRETYGVQATVIMPDSYPDFLAWLPDSQTVVNYERKRVVADSLIESADCIFFLDLNQLSRTGLMEELLSKSEAQKVIIDHHAPISTSVPGLTLSHPELCSTCELVFRIIWQLGEIPAMSRKWATQIYCGMMTDTGGFTFNSSRPEIFFIICQLLTKGIDKDKIYRNVYNNFSSWAIRLRGYIMSQKLNVLDDLHASFFALSRQDMSDYHFTKGDAEGLVNVPLTIKGMKVSVSLREDDRHDRLVWVSIRSVDDFPANSMAEQFYGGGGHLNAAGGHLDCSLEEAKGITRQALQSFAEQLKK